MTIENQVCNYEQAERLFDLGLEPQGGFLFAWYEDTSGDGNKPPYVARYDVDGYRYIGLCPAYTSAELGSMLGGFDIATSYHPGGVTCEELEGAPGADRYDVKARFAAPTEAQARAAMLIHFLELKTLKADECIKDLYA